uniref:Uncharacterized protein n=1 Tax=Arabis nemorensis TaxID=586526 RepID=A0A565C478_9BRAS
MFHVLRNRENSVSMSSAKSNVTIYQSRKSPKTMLLSSQSKVNRLKDERENSLKEKNVVERACIAVTDTEEFTVRYGPSLDEDITSGCFSEKSLVECCGELYIVDRILQGKFRKRKVDNYDDNEIYVVRFPQLNCAIHDDVGIEKCQVSQGKCSNTPWETYKVDRRLGVEGGGESVRKWRELSSGGRRNRRETNS